MFIKSNSWLPTCQVGNGWFLRKKMNFLLILRTGCITALVLSAVTFIKDAVKSWEASPSVTSGRSNCNCNNSFLDIFRTYTYFILVSFKSIQHIQFPAVTVSMKMNLFWMGVATV